MKQIKLIQSQAFSSASGAVGESANSPTSSPTAIDKRVITDEVLGVRRGHRKGIEHIVKGKKKAFETSYSTLSSGSQSQVAEEHNHLGERVDAQQCEIDAQHCEIDAFKALITQMVGWPQLPPPPDDVEDLARDYVQFFRYYTNFFFFIDV